MKHNARILWMPVCDQYLHTGSALIQNEMGGDTLHGKYKVLYWLKFRVTEKGAEILETVKPRKKRKQPSDERTK